MATKNPMPPVRTLAIDALRGLDLQNSADTVDPSRSPAAVNMLRSTPGQLQKRPGWVQQAAYPGAVHGCWYLDGVRFLHAGSRLYADEAEVSAAGAAAPADPAAPGPLADAPSTGTVFGGALYLLDGSCLWRVSRAAPAGADAAAGAPAGADAAAGEADTAAGPAAGSAPVWQLQPVSESAYLPRIAVGKDPGGTGGAELEDVNLLSDGWCESFYTDGSSAVYQLEFGSLSDAPVQVRRIAAAGAGTAEVTLTEGVDFTVDRTLGALTFVSAPPKGPVEGEDSLFVTAYRDRSAQRARILQADVCTVYGTPATGQRLFVTGSPQYPNRDYWSEADDPTYFSDLSYSVLGQGPGRILGYSLLGDSLAAHKSGEGGVWVRCGSMHNFPDAQGNERLRMVFAAGNVIAGYGAVARGSFATLGDEPLFLTAQGVYALTASDLTGQRYQQRRSFFIDPALTAEPNLADARAAVWRDFYLLALNGRVWCLDGLQKTYTPSAPKSAYQYECYLLEGVPAVCLWVRDGVLWFGTASGQVCRFTEGQAAVDCDDRPAGAAPVPVTAYWETPDLAGSRFYKDKRFRLASLRIPPAPVTSVRVLARHEGVWQPLAADAFPVRYFTFSSLVFGKLSFSGDRTCRPICLRLHRRRLDKIRFRFENSEAGEPFGLLGWALEYTEGRNFRR